MNEIQLKEWALKNNIFEAMNKINKLPFFNTMSVEDCNKHLIMFYGEKLIYNPILDCNLDMLANSILSINLDNWTNLLSIKNIDFKNSSERNKTQNTVNKTVSDYKNNTDNNVSGYNSPDLILDNNSVNTNNTNSSVNVDDAIKDVNIVFKDAYNNLLLSNKLNIIESMIKDVSNHITLSLY